MKTDRKLEGVPPPLEPLLEKAPLSAQASLLEESARVIAPFPGGAWVSAEPRLACHGCAAKSGCSSGLLARWRHKRFSQLAVASDIPLVVGQQVRIAVPSTCFLRGAVVAYVLPLVSALIAGMLAETLLSQGHWSVPTAFLAGLAGGVGLSRGLSRRLSRGLRPRVIDARNFSIAE